MTIGNSRLSEPEAHQELILMDSRVAGIIDENFFDRFRRRELSHYDILEQFARLFNETRLCGGKIIHLGKIVSNEMLEFLESDPDVPSGLMLSTGLNTLAEMASFLGPLLAPISSVIEGHGFGRVMSGTNYSEKLDGQSRIFFRRFAHILNMSKGLLSSVENTSVNVVTFEEPSPFELDDSENPFDLDDIEAISETTAAIVKFLVRLALAEGCINDLEKQLIFQVLERVGETISQSQFERLVQEASREPLETILKGIAHESVLFSERLLLSGMLLAAVDGRVVTIEKKLLAQASQLLGISRERYSEIAKDAVHLIKTRNKHLSEKSTSPQEISAPTVSVTNEEKQQIPQHVETTEAPRYSAYYAKPQDHKALVRSSGPSSGGTNEVFAADSGPIGKVPAKALPEKQPNLPPTKAATWRCPACHMPQFREFDECPQCGIIVAKYKAKVSRSEPVEEYMDVPADCASEESVSDRHEHSQPESSTNCPACNAPLREGAKFCPSCGNRVQ